MGALRSIRLTLSILVHFTALTLGAGPLVINPVRALLVVPILTGVVLLGHAVKTSHLDELGYGIVWLWVALLALTVGGVAIEAIILRQDMPPLVEIPVARVLGTIGLIIILVTTYIRGVQSSR
jgi:hypothetical protein